MSAYKHYVIQEGDTIQTIAFKLYRDMEQWHTLVNLNHLEYPYIVDTPQEKMVGKEQAKIRLLSLIPLIISQPIMILF